MPHTCLEGVGLKPEPFLFCGPLHANHHRDAYVAEVLPVVLLDGNTGTAPAKLVAYQGRFASADLPIHLRIKQSVIIAHAFFLNRHSGPRSKTRWIDLDAVSVDSVCPEDPARKGDNRNDEIMDLVRVGGEGVYQTPVKVKSDISKRSVILVPALSNVYPRHESAIYVVQ